MLMNCCSYSRIWVDFLCLWRKYFAILGSLSLLVKGLIISNSFYFGVTLLLSRHRINLMEQYRLNGFCGFSSIKLDPKKATTFHGKYYFQLFKLISLKVVCCLYRLNTLDVIRRTVEWGSHVKFSSRQPRLCLKPWRTKTVLSWEGLFHSRPLRPSDR